MTDEGKIFNGNSLANEGMARDIDAFADGHIFLNFGVAESRYE
jgi:hypothetical protein